MNAWQQIQSFSRPAYTEFIKALARCPEEQSILLQDILLENAHSETGKRYKFDSLKGVDEFRNQVALSNYDSIDSAFKEMSRGARDTQFSGEILAFEETSGSTDARKLIPYTERALTSFQHALYPWLADLSLHYGSILNRPMYWAISPAHRTQCQTEDGTRLGMSDVHYFGAMGGALAELSAVDIGTAAPIEISTWQENTLCQLIESNELGFISVWSPTFLIELMNALIGNLEKILRRLSAQAAARLNKAMGSGRLDTRLLWPNLQLISCWTHAQAAQFILELEFLFPQARIQGKGLLMTEGVVSIPLYNFNYPVLAVKSAFYEFLDPDGNSYLAHEVREGKIYRVVMTTYNGLYRYDTGDQVCIRGWAEATPQLEFMGRTGLVSDMCGEKLTDAFVTSCLPKEYGFAMMAPASGNSNYYQLFLDRDRCDDETAYHLAESLDVSLCNNPQYRYARELRQLSGIVPVRVKNPIQIYIKDRMQKGQRLGDIKPPALRPETNWAQLFEGQ